MLNLLVNLVQINKAGNTYKERRNNLGTGSKQVEALLFLRTMVCEDKAQMLAKQYKAKGC